VVARHQSVVGSTLTEWRAMTGVHLDGTFLVLRAVATSVLRHDVYGSFVAISPVNSAFAHRGLAGHASAKDGITMLVKVAALELAASGIRVNAIAPGIVRTGITAAAIPEPTYGTLRTADGDHVVIAVLEDAMWVRLCTAVGWADWAAEPRLARYRDRQAHAAEIRYRLERHVARLTVAEVVALAGKHDLPLGPADATSDPAARKQIATRFPGRAGRHTPPLPAVLLARLGPAPAPDLPT
jgi:crotonobetainyl-CoA:carnitine CoA-transferase CaiB-like acyl-CoA transferase